MALGHGPTVVTNGLVLALDAADINSFDKNENLLTYTSNIGGPNGYLSTATATPNTSETLDPNGTSTATKLDNAGNVNTYTYSQSTTLSANTTYTYSIHIKQGTKPDFSVTIDENGFGGKRYQTTFTYSTETITTAAIGANDGVLVGSSVTKLTNGWYRLSITFTTSTTSVSTFVDMMNRFGNTPGTNYVWGRQLETGLTVSSYYATTATAKTRGSTIIDLIGNGNNGTLINGPTFNSSNGGSIAFDGTNDNILGTIPSSTFSGAHSICCWFYRRTVTEWAGLFSNNVNTTSCSIFTFISTSNTLGTNQAGVNGTSIAVDLGADHLNKWIYAVITYAGATNGSTVNVYAYKNGSLLSATGSLYWSLSTSSSYYIGRHWTSATQILDGFIPQVSVYNRALTAAEVQQNFNALRGRFGV